ncbi:MAG: [LysW]-aminoadipate/[LysW]-glutamate kinase [Candidatus Nezhaarchaeota archaeon]|nr:[LysW]-aminoadipate/[LysW]-glutamate kinase [Candidatus Nezhaarchaeota archaeon]MCX8141499.1 [LysW]-aminoadipate/[LysW]-glutamate kinase [Candidatus Nezhaarchaeota archaeon]
MVKFGGDLVANKDVLEKLARDIAKVSSREGIVVVHGGGDIVTTIAEKLGKPQVFITSPDGFRSRYTDRETAEIYMMVMAGKINKEVVLSLIKVGVNAVGISGVDGALLRAERKKRLVIIDERGRRRAIEGGYTGRIVGVNGEFLNALLNKGMIPVIAPVAIGDEAEVLNVDGDRAAAHIASALKANTLVLLTDVEGIIINDKLVDRMDISKAKAALKRVGAGMITKLYAAIEALEGGVKRVVIASGFKDEPITAALMGQGTVINFGS